MSDERIEDLTAQLNDMLSSMDWMGRTIRPKLRSSASASELEKMTAVLGREIPADYRAFLKLANGMDGGDQFDWMLAGCSPPNKGEQFSKVKDQIVSTLKGANPESELAIRLEKSVLVGTDFDSFGVFFDIETFDSPEPGLLKISMDDPDQKHEGFPTFENFLSFIGQFYEETVNFMQMPMGDEGDDEEFDTSALDNLGLGDLGLPSRSAPKKRDEDDSQLLAELDSLLGGFDFSDGEPEEEEEEEEMQVSPEMQMASNMCTYVIDKLLGKELIELIPGAENKENLIDFMLRKLMRVTREDQIMEGWISALSKAKEVEELYGTDEELIRVMRQAWDEFAEENG